MKTLNKIVLLSPGKDDSQSGPDSSWLDQLSLNLNLVLNKYTGDNLLSISAENREAAELFDKQVFLILLMHESFSSATRFIKFANNIAADGRLKVGHLTRIDLSSKVAEKLPEAIINSSSVDFYEPGQEAGQEKWLDENKPAYWSRLIDLAAELKSLSVPEAAETRETKENLIYLAQADADMGKNRNIMKRELMEHGFRVLPATDLRSFRADLKSQVQSQVDKCRLAIHLLGNAYGEPMKEVGYSLAEVQVQYISEYLAAIEKDPLSADKEINRLIWIDPEFNPVDSQQEEFVNQLRRNIENLNRTEIIQTPLELFKSLVIKRLRHDSPDDLKAADLPEGKFVYIIHSSADQDEAARLAKGLSKEGMQAGMLDYGGKQQHLLAEHKKFLKTCDSAVIYYGNMNRPWLRSKVMDLLKAPGLGRTHSLSAKQIIAGKKDVLDDYKLPAEIKITKETDVSKAVSHLLKTLKP